MSEPSAWLIEGRVVRYGVPTIGAESHIFEAGCFARSLAVEYPPLVLSHNEHLALGRAIAHDDRPDALTMTFRVPNASDTSRAIDLIERQGGCEFSVSALPHDNGGQRTRDATLREVSIVAVGACPGTGLLSLASVFDEPEPLPVPTSELEREADAVLVRLGTQFDRAATSRTDYDPVEFWVDQAARREAR